MKTVKLVFYTIFCLTTGVSLYRVLRFLLKKPVLSISLSIVILGIIFFKTGNWKVLAAGFFAGILAGVPLVSTSRPPCHVKRGGSDFEKAPDFYRGAVMPAKVETVRIDRGTAPKYHIEVRPKMVYVEKKDSGDIAIRRVFNTDEAVSISLSDNRVNVKNRFYIAREGNLYFRRLYDGRNVFGSEVFLRYRRISFGVFAETPARVGLEIKYRWF